MAVGWAETDRSGALGSSACLLTQIGWSDQDKGITQQSWGMHLLHSLSSFPFLADFLPSFGKIARNPPVWSLLVSLWGQRGTKGPDRSSSHKERPHKSGSSLQGHWEAMQRGSFSCALRGQSQRIRRSKSQSPFRAQKTEPSRGSELGRAGCCSWWTVTFSSIPATLLVARGHP